MSVRTSSYRHLSDVVVLDARASCTVCVCHGTFAFLMKVKLKLLMPVNIRILTWTEQLLLIRFPGVRYKVSGQRNAVKLRVIFTTPTVSRNEVENAAIFVKCSNAKAAQMVTEVSQ